LMFSAVESMPVLEPASTTAVSARPKSAATAPGEFSEPALGSPSAAETTSSPSALGITEATIESLAAAGFVSPGRPSAVPAATSAETIEAETPPSEEMPAESLPEADGSAAMAAYWRWMHARLDAHLEETQVDDLGAPAMHSYRPVAFSWGGALDALEPSRSVGIRERAAFDARAFDGLRDGFVNLG
ncbi:MAG: hypothetical protein ACREUZ_10110, partial [Burkholderiales bacterium]